MKFQFPYWKDLKNKNIIISGATGLIGSALVHVLMERNLKYNNNINIIAISRSKSKATENFKEYFKNKNFTYFEHDVNKPFGKDTAFNCDYIVHGASNTHPISYANDPIGTISTNVMGTKNLLDFCLTQKNCRFVFLSSVEIYGENRGDIHKFPEDYCGYIDCNTLRAGYPESKRTGEALCQAYSAAHGVDIVIPRLSRTYGPSMSWSDSKAIAQFIKKAVRKENITLKSEGNQLYSYTYVMDAVSAILYILTAGMRGEAYNVASKESDVTLKELAQTLADLGRTEVSYEFPDKIESAGYSNATKALLNTEKLELLGWKSCYSIRDGLEETLRKLSYRHQFHVL